MSVTTLRPLIWGVFLMAMLLLDGQPSPGGVQGLEQEEISREYCFLETFEPRCNGSDVIIMKSADYGRMKRGRCIQGDVGYLGCYKDILPYVDRACSGRQACSVKVIDLLNIFMPCSRELLTYLEVSYTCQPVTTGNTEECQSLNMTRVTPTSGVLSSETPYDGTAGTATCPWSFSVPRGQRVRFVLYDFTLRDLQQKAPSAGSTSQQVLECSASLDVRETAEISAQIALCDGSLRERHVYTSVTNQIQVVINYTEDLERMPYFLLSYEAVGCPTFDPPPNMRMTVDADVASIVCNYTGETWYIICRGTQWVGELGNCTIATPVPELFTEGGFPWGIVIAVAIGVGIGTVVGLSLLGIVFLCRRCLCYRKTPKRMPSQKESITARDVPPMNELIRSATAMAKHGDPRGPPPQRMASHDGHVMQNVTAQIEYKQQYGGTHIRQRSKEEHIYESYIYKDGTLLRKDSATESTGSGYCDIEGSVVSEFPAGPPHKLANVGQTLGQTTAHPVGSSELPK